MTADQTDSGNAAAGTNDGTTPIDARAATFLAVLTRTKPLLTTGQCLASAEIRIVEHALVRFRCMIADAPDGQELSRACRSVNRGLARLEPVLDEVLGAHGRAERGRLLGRLREVASEQGSMVSAIGRIVEPATGAAAFRAALAASAERDILMETEGMLDHGVERMEEVLRQNRRGEESREERFARFMQASVGAVDRIEEDSAVKVALAKAKLDELTRQAEDLVAKVEVASGEASLARLNKDRKKEEEKEEAQFRRYRLYGILWAALGLATLFVLVYIGPKEPIPMWLAHLVPAAFVASISTYCIRTAARHRGEVIALRSERLEMDVAVLSVAGGFTEAELRSLKEVRDRLATERAEITGTRTGANDSISLTLPRTMRAMLGATTPKQGPDGRQ